MELTIKNPVIPTANTSGGGDTESTIATLTVTDSDTAKTSITYNVIIIVNEQ